MLSGFGEVGSRFEPRAYADACVADVLLAPQARQATVIGDAALLLACVGGGAAADRLCERWLAVTELPATALLADDASQRGVARLHAARRASPAWARGLPPLDVDAEARVHRRWLDRADSPLRPDGFGSSAAGRIAEELVDQATATPDPLKRLAARAEDAAAEGDTTRASDLLTEWVAKAGPRPRVAQLAGCGHLAPLLAGGALADPLGVPDGWPDDCAGALIAAVRLRHTDPDDVAADTPMAELVRRILAARHAAAAPGEPRPEPHPPAAAETIAAAERRIGHRLPEDYRAFLGTTDGLPADVVFPRLLSAEELHASENGVVIVSERTGYGVMTLVPPRAAADRWRAVDVDLGLGSTPYPSFHALLRAHLTLLEGSHAGAGSAGR